MLKTKTVFSDSFDILCQEKSVPASLQALIGMVLNGHSIREWSNVDLSVEAAQQSTAQILRYNLYTDGKVSLEEPDTANRAKYLACVFWCDSSYINVEA